MKKYILCVLLTVFILSCNTDDNSETSSQMTNVEFTTISKDILNGAGEEGIAQQNLVITNPTAWENLMAQMNTINNVSDNFTETAIDFSEYKIIAIFDQVRGNGGYSIDLNVMSNSETIVVNIISEFPEGNATTVITQPYHIIKIPVSNLPVSFE